MNHTKRVSGRNRVKTYGSVVHALFQTLGGRDPCQGRWPPREVSPPSRRGAGTATFPQSVSRWERRACTSHGKDAISHQELSRRDLCSGAFACACALSPLRPSRRFWFRCGLEPTYHCQCAAWIVNVRPLTWVPCSPSMAACASSASGIRMAQ